MLSILWAEAMPTLKSRLVRIRRPRQCWGCERHFDPGAEMAYCTGVDDGNWWSCYWCGDCQKLWGLYDEEYLFGCFAGEHE